MQLARVFSLRLPLCAAMAALPIVGMSGCFSASEGLDPPSDALYYPTNLVVSPGGTALYVTNSDFDLQYNGGTVQVLDLPALRGKVSALVDALASGGGAENVCKSQGLLKNGEPTLYPGPCAPLEIPPYIKASRVIGAFASGAVFVRHPTRQRARLFVSVRGDPSVTYFEVPDDSDPAAIVGPCGSDAFCLQCAGTDELSSRCSTDHRIGIDETENARGLLFPVEPIGIAASPNGEAIVTAHQTEQAVSAVVNRWSPVDPPAGSPLTTSEEAPTFEYYLPNLPFGPTEVAALPQPGVTKVTGTPIEWQPGFLVTYRAASVIDLIRYQDDHEANPARPFLTRASSVGVTAIARGNDQRGIAIDSSAREQCESVCTAADQAAGGDPTALLACMRACTDVPIGVYIASRAPTSLLIGDVRTRVIERDGVPTSAIEELSLNDAVPLAQGASRVNVGDVIGQDGLPHKRVFAAAFDSTLIFVYDPAARRVESVIRTGRGPHGMAFDTGGSGDKRWSYLYVGHFTDSYIGVVDLDMRHTSTFGSMVLTVGKPTPPRGSK